MMIKKIRKVKNTVNKYMADLRSTSQNGSYSLPLVCGSTDIQLAASSLCAHGRVKRSRASGR
jgi:hypothetical protein